MVSFHHQATSSTVITCRQAVREVKLPILWLAASLQAISDLY